jgi:hypothetical protein
MDKQELGIVEIELSWSGSRACTQETFQTGNSVRQTSNQISERTPSRSLQLNTLQIYAELGVSFPQWHFLN